MTIAFDLDDTLFPEIEFVRSAYRAISRHFSRPSLVRDMECASGPREAFDIAVGKLGLHDAAQLIALYRDHYPDISLTPAVEKTLGELKDRGIVLALITDGRSITQRNKISALGLERFIAPEHILISEETGADKLNSRPFELLESASNSQPYIYVGDKPSTDFYDR
ncbi:MAG: HAD hydrolase-like protein [Duncaniella sp.]|nr:HAD hydrolase-like protein [Duncaniella sp.]